MAKIKVCPVKMNPMVYAAMVSQMRLTPKKPGDHLDKYYVAEHYKYYKKRGWEYIRTYLCKDLVQND